jgi:bacterioferritin-associated ferredoxin
MPGAADARCCCAGEIKAMIICSCNVFSDADVRMLLESELPAAGPAPVYRGLGHRPKCGRCAPTIRQILDERPADARM